MAQAVSWEEKPAAAGRRSSFEVRMDVLKAVSDGALKPTRIMYRSNTSWIVLQRNLAALGAVGFVREAGEGLRQEYTITQKGMEVVRDYAELVERTTREPTEVVR